MVVKQVRAWGFETTRGVMLHSKVVRRSGGDGVSFHAELEYSYEVAGAEYRGSDYRYTMTVNSRRHAKSIVDAHPVDSTIDVFYDPSDPADAVLSPGLKTVDFFLPFFLLPFNLVMLGMFWFTCGAWIRQFLGLHPASIKLRTDHLKTTIRTYQTTPLAATGITILASSFVLIFAVFFGSYLIPMGILLVAAWILVVGLAVYAYIATQPAGTLEIDPYNGCLSWLAKGETEPTMITGDAIRFLAVAGSGLALQSGSGKRKSKNDLHIPCGSESDAAWLRDWLTEELDVKNRS